MSLSELLYTFAWWVFLLGGIGTAALLAWCILVYVLPKKKRKTKAKHPIFLSDHKDTWSKK